MMVDEQLSSEMDRSSRVTIVVVYGLMAVGAAISLVLICDQGRRLVAPPELHATTAHSSESSAPGNVLVHVIGALLAVLTTGRLLGLLFRYVGQPPVIGEIVAGILLGPSLLGRVWPEGYAVLLPPAVGPYLGVRVS
jgi:hypothetical protein